MSAADQLSGFFNRSEFACKCGCGFDVVDSVMFSMLESLRGHFGQPIIINSGCRCEAHNQAVGGSPKSQHKLGKACDIYVKDTSPVLVYEFLDSVMPDFGGLGLYDTFVHVDVRSKKVRW